MHVHVRIFHEQITRKVILTKKERLFNLKKIKRHVVSFELTISTLAAIRSVHSANETVIKRGLHEKMYHSETNTFCYVRKSKIRISDSNEFIRHMHKCQFNFVYL